MKSVRCWICKYLGFSEQAVLAEDETKAKKAYMDNLQSKYPNSLALASPKDVETSEVTVLIG